MAKLMLNASYLKNNIDFFSELVGKSRICAVLKDNAYGHGIEEVAQLVSYFGIRHCSVKNEKEAQVVLQYDFDSVLILYPESYDINDERVIYSINEIKNLDSVEKGISIEVKVDTGMSRNGIKIEDFSYEFLSNLLVNFSVKGFFSHFASANEDEVHLIKQKKSFDDFKSMLFELHDVDNSIRFHICNSDSTILLHHGKSHDTTYYDIYRIGLGLYGYSYSTVFNGDLLKPVMSLESKRISTRFIEPSNRIGYGVSGYKCNRSMMVSNYDLGYGSGFPKIKEQEMYYLPNGNQMLGAMSMDSFSVEGSEEYIIVAEDFISLSKLKNIDYYEILVKFTQNISREVVL
ncbi:alanine racemase [Vibrio cyclitrophicus]|nr:alanine racemase [Vibrio cyclitrophicus]UPR52361.1 alanine racemase [Vibrio cyclitrophicus]